MQLDPTKPLIIAGPCAAESRELMLEVGHFLGELARKLDFQYAFKASFDKANRSSGAGARGPGLGRAAQWFADVKAELGVPIVSDVHETIQVEPAAAVCDVLQIPAFLCRQTDLVAAAAASGRAVNIKKGQFLAPGAMAPILAKAREAAREAGHPSSPILATERGVSFGYGNLVVDMRAFPIMARTGAPVLLDITHSTQLPGAGEGGQSSSAQRLFAPTLARAATATGYLSGFFLEVHTDPARAISDKDAQLNFAQAEALLTQLVPLWRASRSLAAIDPLFDSQP